MSVNICLQFITNIDYEDNNIGDETLISDTFKSRLKIDFSWIILSKISENKILRWLTFLLTI